MARAHSAKGTIKEIAAILISIADGALIDPRSSGYAREAIILKMDAERARSHYDLAVAAARGSYWFAKYGDDFTATVITDLMEGRA